VKISRFLTRAVLVRFVLVALAGYALYWGGGVVRKNIRMGTLAGVDLTGVHHLGDKFNIAEFYVNGYSGANVGREGGGGRSVCCVLLPKKWRPGLTAEVRWDINDWTNENRAEIKAGNYRSVAGQGMAYIAQVPVERYEVASHVWVHFFAGGKVRVVSSPIGSEGSRHPIKDDDPHAADSATAGRPVDALFSSEEVAEMTRKDLEDRKTNGDWR
jgi:hypothetical protein